MTAAERPATPSRCARPDDAARSPGPSTPSGSSGSPPGWRRSASGAATRSAMMLRQPARVPPRRHRRRCTSARRRSRSTTPRRRADRVPVRQRRQPRGRHRARVPAGDPRGSGATRSSTSSCVEELDPLERPHAVGFDFDARVARGRARRRADADLHVGHDRAAEGRRRLTHANMIAELRGCSTRPRRRAGRAQSRPSCPRAHIADRWSVHYYALDGARLHGHLGRRTRATVVADLPEVRPTVWGAVPRVWEKIKAGAGGAGRRRPGRAAGRAQGRRSARSSGSTRRSGCVVGAAPTPVEVLEFFAALGMPIREVWGMSRDRPAARRSTRADAIAVGTVRPGRSRASSCSSPTTASCSCAARS